MNHVRKQRCPGSWSQHLSPAVSCTTFVFLTSNQLPTIWCAYRSTCGCSAELSKYIIVRATGQAMRRSSQGTGWQCVILQGFAQNLWLTARNTRLLRILPYGLGQSVGSASTFLYLAGHSQQWARHHSGHLIKSTPPNLRRNLSCIHPFWFLACASESEIAQKRKYRCSPAFATTITFWPSFI